MAERSRHDIQRRRSRWFRTESFCFFNFISGSFLSLLLSGTSAYLLPTSCLGTYLSVFWFPSLGRWIPRRLGWSLFSPVGLALGFSGEFTTFFFFLLSLLFYSAYLVHFVQT